ncbi:Nif11-like leader peptide family natural product precursor [Cyanobium sp. ATX 6A2]|uniref:Nif11-like leader peptide family natural product precursor n=1 Tax=Cyanobium sp. ATX 6A2 TaxID=2823700 RepID=UPI0020CF70FE|nr:Nif11-like leader peptide family natural product precursor [Cyanobium sp. ATX 6A2]MCP9888144.1 Nif11-like leader peptide family natural product precursor [Cyanobium sp. ATX 6A2]
MPASGLQGLMKAAYNDPALEARLKAPGADPVAIAAEAGFSITLEEFNNALEAWESWRMSRIHDEEQD